MVDPPDPPLHETMRAMAKVIMSGTPHARALGFELTDVDRGRAWGRAPFRADLVGDPARGAIAGGVITALLDNLCGVAAIAALDAPTSTATLDLRIDYMRPAAPGRDILAEAHCYKVTRSVAFVRAVAFDETADDPVAHVAAAFMLASNNGRGPGANLAKPGGA
jgi:uncharacterized protein (TIGR00369 family)